MTGVLVVPFRVKNAVLVPFRVFSFKMSSVVASVTTFKGRNKVEIYDSQFF